MIDVEKAFEGRWRFKGFDEYEVRQLSGLDVKAICRDFFEAGFTLASRTVSSDSVAADTAFVTDPSFDHFWNLYDKKVGRPKSEKLWAKLSAKEKKACLDYIPLYKQAQPDKTFRKNPETFLRNKSWQDEIIYRHSEDQQRDARYRAAAGLIADYAGENR